MPSREEYLKWASGISWTLITRVEPEDIEALCNRVWNEAIEAAAKDVDHIYSVGGITQGDLIRKLKRETK